MKDIKRCAIREDIKILVHDYIDYFKKNYLSKTQGKKLYSFGR